MSRVMLVVLLIAGPAGYLTVLSAQGPAAVDPTVSENDSMPGNYILLSAVRSIAGKAPPSEMFDLNLKFDLVRKPSWALFSHMSMDIPLSDSAGKSDFFTELGFSVDLAKNLIDNQGNQRSLFLGLNLKVFDSDEYFGFHIGSLEESGPLFTSYFTIGYLSSVYSPDSLRNATAAIKEHKHNLYIEAALYPKGIDVGFLKHMRIKLGYLMPIPFWDLNTNPEAVQSDRKYRIVLEVPLGDPARF